MSELEITIKPSPLSLMMNTGYHDFESSAGIVGMAKIENDILSLLAVVATEKGTGQFRTFMAQAKEQFKTIEVLEVWDAALATILLRYGFHRPDGVQNVFVWSKE